MSDRMAYRLGHGNGLAGVYAALAYYHANREQIDAEIAADEAEATCLEQEYSQKRQVLQ